MLEPVNPLTCVTPNFAAALAVSFIFSAALLRTPSGSPSPQTSGGRVALWRLSMGSQTAWPTRWLEIAQPLRAFRRRVSHPPSTAPSSASARSTSKWSPQQASSSPSKPQPPHLLASSSSGRSAHCPVNSVTGLAKVSPPPLRARRAPRPRSPYSLTPHRACLLARVPQAPGRPDLVHPPHPGH